MSSVCKLLVAVVLVASCRGENDRADAVAAAAAPPGIEHPVGPVPGFGIVNPAKNPFDGNPVALAQGRQFYMRYNCYGCHGDHGGGGMGPSLRDQEWRYGGSPPDIFNSVAQGRIGMPGWGTQVPAEQIWQITAYIQSMRTPREPEPPTR